MIEYYGGATITGQSHLEIGQKNQDHFSITKYNFGLVMVVADGLGSKKHSDIGSNQVCKAVGEATKIWFKKNDAPIELLIKLIHNIWDMLIYPHPKNECSTTCLFAIILNDGRVVLAQLGDGIIYYLKNNSLVVFDEKNDDFINITNSMSSVKSINDWKYTIINISNDNFSLFMTTDGLSEDIIFEKRKDFMLYILKKLKYKTNQKRKNFVIKKILHDCEGEYNSDDKTLIVYSREERINE